MTLLSLANGMQEAGTTKTDSQGHYTLNVPDQGGQHLVRAVVLFDLSPELRRRVARVLRRARVAGGAEAGRRRLEQRHRGDAVLHVERAAFALPLT